MFLDKELKGKIGLQHSMQDNQDTTKTPVLRLFLDKELKGKIGLQHSMQCQDNQDTTKTPVLRFLHLI